MSQRAQDLLGKAMEKPHFRERYLAAKAKNKAQRRQKKAMETLTRGGILIPKPNVLRESMQELREQGHAYADQVEKMLRKMK